MKANKPQWLIDAEEKLKEFNESKYGKMTEGQFTRAISSAQKNSVAKYVQENPEHQKKAFAALLAKNPNHQSHAGKAGGVKGGIASHKVMLERYGEEGLSELRKESHKKVIQTCPDWHMRGNKVSLANRQKKLNELYMQIIADLPETFIIPELEEILQKYNKRAGYVSYIMKHLPQYFEIIEKGKKGWSHTKYRVINR